MLHGMEEVRSSILLSSTVKAQVTGLGFVAFGADRRGGSNAGSNA
jgi:hypothetical protein